MLEACYLNRLVYSMLAHGNVLQERLSELSLSNGGDSFQHVIRNFLKWCWSGKIRVEA